MLYELRTRADQTNPQQQNDDTNGGAEVDVTVSSGRFFHKVAPFDRQPTTKMSELVVTQIVSTFDLRRLPNNHKYPTLSHHEWSDAQKFIKTFLVRHLCVHQHAILLTRAYS